MKNGYQIRSGTRARGRRYETLVKTEVTCELIRDYVAEEKDRFGDFDILRVILGIKAEKESE